MTTIMSFIAKHPVTTYFALTFAISWGGVLLVIGGPARIRGLKAQDNPLFPLALLAMVAGPSLVGLLLTALLDGRPGLRQLRTRLLEWCVRPRWYAVALLAAPLVAAATTLTLSLFSPEFLPAILVTDDKTSLLLLGLVVGLTAGIFEELGWTGFAIPRLKLQYGVLATGVIVGVLWSAWHFLVVVWGIGERAGAVPLAIFMIVDGLAGLPVFRVLMVWVYDRTESLFVAMLMHLSITATTLILTPRTTGVRLLAYGLAFAAAVWIVIAAAALVNSGRLSRQSRAAREKDSGRRRLPITASPEFERFAQEAQFRDRIAVVVRASPEAIFQALREVALRDMKLAWALGEIRYLPSRLGGHLRAADSRQPFLMLLIERGTIILRDDSPRELITGSAAELHRVHQRPRRFVTSEAFDAFADRYHEKLFMSIRVVPTGRPDEHWLVLEHATKALSHIAERRFSRYWRVIKPLGAFVSWRLLCAIRRKAQHGAAATGRARTRWRTVRATAAERVQPLPGDDLIAEPLESLNHAITINRPVRDVWPWLTQMGAGSRAGWYSYDLLDNGRQRSAERIVPELQHLTPGMIFPALPGVTDCFTLLAFEPERHLILGWLPGGRVVMTWAFVLRQMASGSCRLVVRARVGEGYHFQGLPWWMTSWVGRTVHFIMQRKQLFGIKDRAELMMPCTPGSTDHSRSPERDAA